jgi:hypothetical protein
LKDDNWMKLRLGIVFALLAVLVAGEAGRPAAQGVPLLGFPPGTFSNRAALDPPAGAAPPAIDGTAKTTSGTYTNPNTTGTLTTSNGGSHLLIAIAAINGLQGNIDSVAITDSGAHTWTFLIDNLGDTTVTPIPVGSTANRILMFYTVVSGSFSGTVTGTISPGASIFYQEILAFAFSGINATPFDPNASWPAFAISGALTGLSTTHANDLVFGAVRGGGTVTPPSGWTAAGNMTGDFVQAYYKTFTSTQSGLTIPDTSSPNNGIVGDAIAGP